MQRKNSILKITSHKKRGLFLKKRSGFAMIMAIAVIVIISTIMALSLALTTETNKRTVDLYLYEQVALHAKSAAELALLEIAQNGCQNNFTTDFGGSIYTADVTMRYIYTGATTNVAGVACSEYISYIVTPEQNGSVLMDVTVSVNDANITTEPISYFRRTIQKL